MMTDRFDVLILGAGIVGVSVALHLQERGSKVALVDRRAAGLETSYGNAGFIESSAILPHPFPKGMRNLVKFALNRSAAVRTDYSFLPRILPWIVAYQRASGDRSLATIGLAFRRLIAPSLSEHRALLQKANATSLLKEDGWLELCRSDAELRSADREAEKSRRLGIAARRIDASTLYSMEPAVSGDFAGAIHWSDTARITDPGGLVTRLASLFVERQGTFVTGNAFALETTGSGWRLPNDGIVIEADQAVVALGPWSRDLASKFGYRIPLVAKRGYHRHFENTSSPPLTRAIYVRDRQCLIVPTVQGVRVLSGVELAPRDAAPTPWQLERMVECARETLNLGQPVETAPWLGARPCLPDMLPVIGAAPRHPGLWFAFGHGHYGFTQGPLTGRLIAELVTGAKPLLPVEPYAPGRFEKSA